MENCVLIKIIQFKDAINYNTIKIITKNSNNIVNNCKYSWSIDNVCWVDWCTYADYNRICKTLNTDFYLKIKIFDEFDKIYIGNNCNNCYSITYDDSCIFLQNFCDNPSLFQPYNNLDCALYLQQQLADSIICMFGIPIYYIKCEPQQDTIDYTFKEYVMHNVKSIKQLKLMITDGQMPSSNPKLSEIGFDWQIDWDTELSKTQFANAFGDQTIPTQRDMVYIPMMKRMWMVNSAYDEKNEGLMWRSTTWKISLIKYVGSTNIENNDYDEIFDNWVPNTYEKIFGNIEEIEQNRETGSTQIKSPEIAATNLYNIFMEDSVRKQYTKDDILILNQNYCHKNIIFGRNIYKFRPNGIIVYQNGICGKDGTLMFLIETPGSAEIDKLYNIIQFGEINIYAKFDGQYYKLLCDSHELIIEPFKTYMIVLKWNKINYVNEFIAYMHTHIAEIPQYMLKPEMYYLDFDNPIKSVIEYNLDWESNKELVCKISGYPFNMTNIKLYNKYLDFKECSAECVKYTTNNKNCIINDLARPILTGHGYSVK